MAKEKEIKLDDKFIANQLDIKLIEGEKLSFEMLQELAHQKGEDENE